MTPKEKQSALFASLVMMFQTAALQQMGKLKHPVSDKVERDLEQAQLSIDMLDMLATLTKGNLDETETRLVSDVVRDLKLNYVEEAAKPPAADPPEQEPS